MERAPADVVAEMIAPELGGLGADAGFVATVAEDGKTIEVARVTQWSSTPVRLEFPRDAPYPLAEAIRTRAPLFIGSNEQLACDHPGLIRVKHEDHACATLPLVAGSDVVGAVNFGYEEPREFTADELRQFDALATRCATALAELREQA